MLKHLSSVDGVPYLGGGLMALLWSAYGVPMVYIRLSYGVPTEFHRGSVEAWSGEGREMVGAWLCGHWGPLGWQLGATVPRIEIRGYGMKHPAGVLCSFEDKDTLFFTTD